MRETQYLGARRVLAGRARGGEAQLNSSYD